MAWIFTRQCGVAELLQLWWCMASLVAIDMVHSKGSWAGSLILLWWWRLICAVITFHKVAARWVTSRRTTWMLPFSGRNNLVLSRCSLSVFQHAALSQTHIALPEFDRAISIKNAPDGVISVGGVSRWFFRGSRPMWLMHWALAFPWGRAYVRNKMKVDVDLTTWPAEAHPRLHEIQPLDPRACVATIAPTPLLIIQGEHDNYFPPEHGEKLYAAAQVPQHQAEYWFVSGMGHAENAITRDVVDQLKEWVASHVRSGR